MFRIIGAVVVYGFATYGLLVWLTKNGNEEAPGFREAEVTNS